VAVDKLVAALKQDRLRSRAIHWCIH
jgi:hypothetical protein